MRALFYHPSHVWTGSARAFAHAGRGLARRGWQVTFACAEEGEARRHAERLGLHVVAVEADANVLGATGDLARVVREQFAEAVFVHGERDHLVAAGAVWRAGRGAVVRRVPAGEQLTVGRTLRTALARQASCFLFTTPAQAEALGARERPLALGSVVAELGVELPPLAPPPAAGDDEPPRPAGRLAPRTLVCVHEPRAQLATATMLRATAMLAPRHPGLRVALVGPGADDEGLRMHAAALGINRVVEHLGDRVEAPALLPHAALAWVVAAGDDGGFGALDAMAARVPVLVERGSVAAGYAPDGIAGVHLEPGDVPGTAAVIAQLLTAEPDRLAMGAAGRARVERTNALDPMVDGFARAAAAARDRTRWRA